MSDARAPEASEFDARARTWDEDAAKHARARRVADLLAERIPSLPAKRVLDYGAGTGLLGLALQPRVAEVVLADSSREMLAVAEEKIALRGLRNVRTLKLDLAVDPVSMERFDAVVTLMTLHHVADTDGILRAFHDLLSPGGSVGIVDLDREDGSFHGPGFTGHAGFDRGDLRTRLERAGFRDVAIETALAIEKATAAGTRTYPAFLAIATRA